MNTSGLASDSSSSADVTKYRRIRLCMNLKGHFQRLSPGPYRLKPTSTKTKDSLHQTLTVVTSFAACQAPH
jgi:hypothetical protein